MLRDMTRSRLIQVWFVAIALIGAASVVLGRTVSLGTALTLAVLSLVPPAIVLMLWPGVQPRSASDVIHDTNRGA